MTGTAAPNPKSLPSFMFREVPCTGNEGKDSEECHVRGQRGG